MDVLKQWPETRGRKPKYSFEGFNVGDIWTWTATGTNVVRGKIKRSFPHAIYLAAMSYSRTRGLGWVIERRTVGLQVHLKRIK